MGQLKLNMLWIHNSYILQLVLPFSMANVLAAQRFDSGCDMLSPRTPAFLLDSKNVESSNFLDMTVSHIQNFSVNGNLTRIIAIFEQKANRES